MFSERWGIVQDSLDVFMIKPNREDLMRFTALQKVRKVETLRARLAVIKKLNSSVSPLLRYCTLRVRDSTPRFVVSSFLFFCFFFLLFLI